MLNCQDEDFWWGFNQDLNKAIDQGDSLVGKLTKWLFHPSIQELEMEQLQQTNWQLGENQRCFAGLNISFKKAFEVESYGLCKFTRSIFSKFFWNKQFSKSQAISMSFGLDSHDDFESDLVML